jgi:hypothetical protein
MSPLPEPLARHVDLALLPPADRAEVLALLADGEVEALPSLALSRLNALLQRAQTSAACRARQTALLGCDPTKAARLDAAVNAGRVAA